MTTLVLDEVILIEGRRKAKRIICYPPSNNPSFNLTSIRFWRSRITALVSRHVQTGRISRDNEPQLPLTKQTFQNGGHSS